MSTPRLELYKSAGYETEVVSNPDQSVTVVLSLPQESYRANLRFCSMRDADEWNAGAKSIPYEFNETKRSTWGFMRPSPSTAKLNQKSDLDGPPIRVIEFD